MTGGGETHPVALRWSGPRTLHASFPAESGKLYQAVVEHPGTSPIELPPATLPYSPELALRSGDDAGDQVLTQLARATGGASFTSAEDLPRARKLAGETERALTPWLAALLLCVLALEIAVRRGLLDRRLAALRERGERVRARWRPRRTTTSTAGTAVPADPVASDVQPAQPPNPAPPPEADDPLVLAKRRARRR